MWKIKFTRFKLVFLNLIVFYIIFKIFQFYSNPDLTINNVIHNHDKTSGSTLLDLNNFYYIINTDVCKYSKPKYIIIITSHINNTETRAAIRYSYPKDLFQKLNVQFIFLLGTTGDMSSVQHIVERETIKHNDIIQGNFIEAYRNLTYKHIMGLKWITEFCGTVKYVIKMDDDIVINYYKLFEVLSQLKYSKIIGCVIKNMKPIRIKENKWYVSYTEYSNLTYPPFVSGWIYIVTIDIVKNLLYYSNKVPYFWIDDVFVTGILAKHAHVSHTDIRQHFRYEPEDVTCCISGMHVCDFVAAPSGGNYSLQIKLNQHIWECKYKKSCLNNMLVNKKNCIKKKQFTFLKGSPHIYELNSVLD